MPAVSEVEDLTDSEKKVCGVSWGGGVNRTTAISATLPFPWGMRNSAAATPSDLTCFDKVFFPLRQNKTDRELGQIP